MLLDQFIGLSSVLPAIAAEKDDSAEVTYLQGSDLLYDLMETATTFVIAQHKELGGSHYAYTEGLFEESTGDSPAGTESVFRTGSRLVLMRLEAEGDRIKKTEKVILESRSGCIRDVDVSADGTKCIFSWKQRNNDDFHVYEMELTSGEYDYRQLTFGSGVADTEPMYLPNGEILFSSTRAIQTVDCWKTPVSNFYKMTAEGENIIRLGYDQVHTTYPTLTEDGRVIYTRWDYNDRTQMWVQGLFQMNPDGTNQTELYGNSSNFPTTLVHTRQVPGEASLYVSIATGHHTHQPGKLCFVNVSKGRDGKDSVSFPLNDGEKTDNTDKYGQSGAMYQYPYALNAHQLLVSRDADGYSGDKAFGIWLMDIRTGEKLELSAGSAAYPAAQIIPVKTREMFVRPSMVDYSKSTGTYYIGDVYVGDAVKGVERGTVKQIRVVALDFRAYTIGNTAGSGSGTSGQYTPISTGNGSWDVKTVLGVATVYEDGSAMFTVPSETPLYFQLLDKDGNVVQTMRSWSTLMPNEFYSCVGCHEDNNTAPPASATVTMALKAGVETLKPDAWQADEADEQDYDPYTSKIGFDYLTEVQPILDANCVSCHNNKELSYYMIDAFNMDESGISSSSEASASKVEIFGRGETWQYYISASNNPAAGWNNVGFKGNWKTGKAGFGDRSNVASVGTKWNGGNNWLFVRKTFNIDDPDKFRNALIQLDIFYDDDAKIYLNGNLIFSDSKWVDEFVTRTISTANKNYLRKGENVLAISINQHTGGRYIDCGLSFLISESDSTRKTLFGRGETWQYYISASNNPAAGWNNVGFTGSWKTGKAGFGDRSNVASVGTKWSGSNNWLFVRKTFNIDDPDELKNAMLQLDVFYDDDVKIYLNGNLIFSDSKWVDEFVTRTVSTINKSYFRKGENVLAISLNQHTGGRYIDCGLSAIIPGDPSDIDLHPFSLEGDSLGAQKMSRYLPLSYLVLTASKPKDNVQWVGDPENRLTSWISSMSSVELKAANSFGAIVSPLMTMLREGHSGVKLSDTDLRTIAAWLDLAVPAYGRYDANNHWDKNEYREAEEEQNKRDYYTMLNSYTRLALAGKLPKGTVKIEFVGKETYTIEAEGIANLYVPEKYRAGNKITITLPEGEKYVGITINGKMGESIVYCPNGTFTYVMPNVATMVSTISSTYANTTNYVTARLLTEEELLEKRNLAENGFDYTNNASTKSDITDQFPHATASSEWEDNKGETYFHVRNAIDGFTNNQGHGKYPVQSWGPANSNNQWMEIDFGRAVIAEELGIVIRYDVGHDTWFSSAEVLVTYEDGTTGTQKISIEWTGSEQIFKLDTDKPITKIRIGKLIAAKTGGWAALSEVKVYGTEAPTAVK